jgi:hypothetical protein
MIPFDVLAGSLGRIAAVSAYKIPEEDPTWSIGMFFGRDRRQPIAAA